MLAMSILEAEFSAPDSGMSAVAPYRVEARSSASRNQALSSLRMDRVDSDSAETGCPESPRRTRSMKLRSMLASPPLLEDCSRPVHRAPSARLDPLLRYSRSSRRFERSTSPPQASPQPG